MRVGIGLELEEHLQQTLAATEALAATEPLAATETLAATEVLAATEALAATEVLAATACTTACRTQVHQRFIRCGRPVDSSSAYTHTVVIH